jgi:hypothetical protein
MEEHLSLYICSDGCDGKSGVYSPDRRLKMPVPETMKDYAIHIRCLLESLLTAHQIPKNEFNDDSLGWIVYCIVNTTKTFPAIRSRVLSEQEVDSLYNAIVKENIESLGNFGDSNIKVDYEQDTTRHKIDRVIQSIGMVTDYTFPKWWKNEYNLWPDDPDAQAVLDGTYSPQPEEIKNANSNTDQTASNNRPNAGNSGDF